MIEASDKCFAALYPGYDFEGSGGNATSQHPRLLRRTIGALPSHRYTVYAHRTGYLTLHSSTSTRAGCLVNIQSVSELLSIPVRVGVRKKMKIPRATSECDTIATVPVLQFLLVDSGGLALVFAPHVRGGRSCLLGTYPPPMARLVKSLPQHPPVSDIQARNRLTPLKLIFEPVIPKFNHKLHFAADSLFPTGNCKSPCLGKSASLHLQATYRVPDLSIIASQRIYAGCPYRYPA